MLRCCGRDYKDETRRQVCSLMHIILFNERQPLSD
jgi:hypothetical protein